MVQFSSFSEFFAMGGYGLYVWLSFGIGLGCALLMWFVSLRSKTQLFARVRAEQARQQRIKQAASQSTNS